MTEFIAYQGEPGANSDIACRDAYPLMTPLPCASFEDAFAAVTDGAAMLAMIPIENSIAGRVADIHHFLPNSGLHIVGEYFLPIHFQLMAPRGAALGGLRGVYSHVHALGQCRRIIRKLGIRPIVSGDTAGSLFCGGGGKFDCNTVAAHPSSWQFGLPLPVWGIIYYIAAAALALLAWRLPAAS